MADHVHGTMETSAQEKTYEGFIKVTARSLMVILGIFVILAIFGA